MQVVYVEWADATSRIGWRDIESTDFSVAKVRSLGYLVKEDDEKLCLTTSITADNDAVDVLSIPKGWIVNRKDIDWT